MNQYIIKAMSIIINIKTKKTNLTIFIIFIIILIFINF